MNSFRIVPHEIFDQLSVELTERGKQCLLIMIGKLFFKSSIGSFNEAVDFWASGVDKNMVDLPLLEVLIKQTRKLKTVIGLDSFDTVFDRINCL